MSGEEGMGPRQGLSLRWRALLTLMAFMGILVVGALILTLGEANRQRDGALSLQAHSYDMMILARTLSGTIARSEASLGRYVISGDKQLGRLYVDEWRIAGDQINRLEAVARDNDEQQKRLEQLRGAFNERGEELSLIALSTNYGKNNQALARYYKAREGYSLQRINVTLDAIIGAERALLRQRTANAMAAVERSTRLARIFSIFGISLVIGAVALGWVTVRVLGQRAVARADADAERERAEELALAVARATQELREQESRLRQVQKMEAIGQLTGGIAHDFNNMLAVVLGGLELARRNLPDTAHKARRHVDSAAEGAHRAAALTRQLLAFAREDAINPEPLNASDLITGMRNLLDRTLGDAITVNVVDQSHGWRVRADRVQLENAILNLAVNARDAMEGRGALTIHAQAVTLAAGEQGACSAGEHLAIGVADTGCGMSPEVAERVFEPFFTTKPVGKGTGLGLSQIFGFARQLGGEVGIVSAPLEGTTVTLYLPRDVSSLASFTQAPSEPITPQPTNPTFRILVVEDDPRVLAATTGALTELGHSPIACHDPLRAEEMLSVSGRIDLIVTDVLMPGCTGPEMIAALGPDHADIAVLFVTGFAGEASDKVTFGRHQVLRKPFTLAQLERAVLDAVATAKSVSQQQIAAE